MTDLGKPFDALRVRQRKEESGVDVRAIESVILELLAAIGENPAREGLRDTPARVARSWEELTAGYREDPASHLQKRFKSEGSELVLQRDIPFYSICEHHLVPFHGVAHVAYIPKDYITGLSKIVRMVRGYAARLQVQERLTMQIAKAVNEILHPIGVAVVLRAEHLCIGMRGIRTPGSITTTSAVYGVFSEDARARSEVMELMG